MEKLSNDGKNISTSGIIFGSLIAQRGPRGEQGIQGVQGDKPIKGIDYFTEEDKEELVQETSVIVNERFTPEYEQMQKEIEYAIGNINDMTESYNNNASEKTAEFNTNAENKINEYNANAENLINKTDELKLENTRLRNQIPTGSAEGESITLNDSSNLQYKKFNICGKSVQDGTPTPEAPIEIQGVGDDVNLFDKTTITEGKYINADSGGFSINDVWGVTDYIEVTENKEYISSGTNTIGANPSVCFFDSDKNFISGIRHNNINPFVFTTPENCKYIIESVYLSDIDTFKLQKGTVATAYSEYGKGTVEIKQTGENIISSTSVSGGYNDIAPTITNGVINVKGTNNADYSNKETYRNGFVHIKTVDRWEDNVTYYFSCKVEVVSNQKNLDTSYFSCFLYGQAGFTITYNSKTGRYEGKVTNRSGTTEKEKHVEIRLDGCELNISEIMLTTEETYEYKPYFKNNYVIPLSQPLRSLPNGVCDTIEEDGIHRRVGSVVLDGTQTVSYSNYEGTFLIYANKLNMQYSSIYGLSTHFKNIPDTSVTDNAKANIVLNDGEFAFRDGDTKDRIYFKHMASGTDKNNFQTWLSENPIQVQYELAEEVIEPFDEEQKAVIDEIYNTGTFKGVTNISSSSEIAPEFDIEYYKDLETLFNNLSQAIIGGN